MAEEEEWAKLPLSEQFTHKNWKARKGGYETAAKGFSTAQPSDPIVRDFILDSSLWKGAVSDANVAAQQEALNSYNAFLDIAGTEGARKTRSLTIAPIVEKGLTGRPAAKQAALESLLLLIELDKADPVVEELLPFITHKQPKLIAAMLSALTSIVHAYGCKIVEPKAVVKILPKAFGHADKNVRAEGQNLTVELYRWLREAMKPLFWSELKPVQQTDLEKLFGPVQSEPPAKQDRLLRSQQAAREVAAAATEDAETYEEDDAEVDLEPEFMAVDVTAKIPKDLGERLSSSKWKDRKEVLDEVFAAVNVPAIQEGHFDEIVRGCAKGMKDANIMVVVVSANVIEALAKGLRKAFAKYRSTILAPMLERFKEKKANVTDAIGAACDAVFMSTNLGDIQADSLEALKSKNPQVKESTAKFLIRSFKTTREPPSLEQTKEYAEAAKKLLSESAAPLRDAGAEILGVMWKIMGDRNMLAHMEGVDEIRKTKIKEFCDAAEVKAKWKPKTAPPLKAAAPSAASRRPPPSAKKSAPVARRPAPPPASPSPVEDDVPPAPRSVARPVSKPPGSLRPPGAGLKPPSGLQKPGLKGPSTLTSPKRQGVILEEPPVLAAPRTPAGANRGLAGRPLGKPAAPSTPPPAPREAPPTPSFSSVERQELVDLREEVDLVRQQASDLRQEKMRLTSQIHELQNQNAQLIEDHTRDVLQIKAKETQLVRARSDAENAEERAHSLAKEIERLKREMGRLGRQSAGRESPVDYGNNSGYRPYNTHRPYSVQSGYGADGFDTIAEDSEANNRPTSVGSSGRGTASIDGALNGQNGTARNSSMNKSSNEGVESWRRAAEVTQNLKARIEMMKARQNIGRGQ